MPCTLTANLEYPDYIKRALKEIELGDDNDLKIAACQLKTPINEDGCPILDEDNKAGLFPFCTINTEENPSEIIGDPLFIKRYPIGFTLKELMEFFWVYKNYRISGVSSSTDIFYCQCPDPPYLNTCQCSYNKTTTYLNTSITSNAELQNKDEIKDVIKLFSEGLSAQYLAAPGNITTEGLPYGLNPYPVAFYVHWFLNQPCYIYENKFYPHIMFGNGHEQWNSAFTVNSVWPGSSMEFIYTGKLNINTYNRVISIDVYIFSGMNLTAFGSTSVNLFMNQKRI